MSLLQTISQWKDHLTQAEHKIAKYVLEYPNLIPNLTTNELAQKVGVGDATVVRFCKSIGVGSFKTFKLTLVRELATHTINVNDFSILKEKDTPHELFQKVTQLNKDALEFSKSTLQKKEFENAVKTLGEARRMAFFGVGGSATAAFDGYYKFSKLGYSALTSGDFHFMLSYLTHFGENDILIGLSHSGQTSDVCELAKFAQNRGAHVLAITANSKSQLAKISNTLLVTPNLEQDYRIGSIASKMTQLNIIDGLYVSLFHQIGADVLEQFDNARSEAVKLRR
ncbi:MurR/RpiR family transcriptional regulator [Bacillus fonticola]|uniref:MurR/RpiR family transcriptional regulator n=1 Tax=Bacillus fonticola TaxID=2728853 RepID=UPI001D15DAA5|nr:MurR/RpiR family transcriptional regulator [Bacillus fonticola]